MSNEIEYNVRLTLDQVRTLEGLVSNEWETMEAESIKDLSTIRILSELSEILHPLCLYGTDIKDYTERRVRQ